MSVKVREIEELTAWGGRRVGKMSSPCLNCYQAIFYLLKAGFQVVDLTKNASLFFSDQKSSVLFHGDVLARR
jgi:hypothetical protein